MSTAREAVEALRDQVGSVYPARVAELSRHTGSVTAVIHPTLADYEAAAMCTPVPVTLTAEITILSGTGGEPGVLGLIGHIDAVAVLIRAAGWEPDQWRPDAIDDHPSVVITATTSAEG